MRESLRTLASLWMLRIVRETTVRPGSVASKLTTCGLVSGPANAASHGSTSHTDWQAIGATRVEEIDKRFGFARVGEIDKRFGFARVGEINKRFGFARVEEIDKHFGAAGRDRNRKGIVGSAVRTTIRDADSPVPTLSADSKGSSRIASDKHFGAAGRDRNRKGLDRAVLSLLLWLGTALVAYCQPPPDADWTANAVLADAQAKTIEGIGAGQGISLYQNKAYIYGDVYTAIPRVGVIKELDAEFQPTGRELWLTKDGQTLIQHPTGLTWDEQWGAFLGDTVDGKATIYQLDWQQAWEDGNLDNAVLAIIEDDAAVNGCRPEFVTLNGKRWLATADYGDVRPEIRLYDPAKLLKAKRSSAPGVIGHRILVGPFNQNLHWDEERGWLICVQNVVAGRGWQLDAVDLAKAVEDGRANGPGVRATRWTFPPHNELEGFGFLGDQRGVFVTAHREANLVVGKLQRIEPRPTPAGTNVYNFK